MRREDLAALAQEAWMSHWDNSAQDDIEHEGHAIADAILSSDWLAAHDAEVGERIARAIFEQIHWDGDGASNSAYRHAASITRQVTT